MTSRGRAPGSPLVVGAALALAVSVLAQGPSVSAEPGRTSSPVSPSVDPPPLTPGTTFVLNQNANSVTEYAPGANGNVSPIATISGPNTGLNDARTLALGPAGDLFVADTGNNSVTEYTPGASGNASPIATISGPNTGLDGLWGLAVSSTGELFVANFGGNSVTEYARGASGNASPIATISGPNTGLDQPTGLTLDPSGGVFVADVGNNSVTSYSAGANGNASPTGTLTGGNTGLSEPVGLALSQAGDVFVINQGNTSITEYAPGPGGNASPIATISGSSTGLNGPQDLAFGPTGDLFVVNDNQNSPSVTGYAPGANGNAPPIATISGAGTGLSAPFGIAVVHQSWPTPGTTFVLNDTNNTGPVTEYVPGADGNASPIATFSVTGPPNVLAVGPSGDLFVGSGVAENSSVTQYAPGANGNAPQLAEIVGPNTGLDIPRGLAFGPTEDLIVANFGGNSVTEYASGANGNALPMTTIIGPQTGLNGPQDLAVGPSGELFVANNNPNSSITEYAPGANGNASPVATISGPNTGLAGPTGLALGPTGDLFVANGNNSVTEYAPGAKGNASPIATISGTNTGLDTPHGLALGPSGDLSVANLSSSAVTEYAPGANGNVAPIATISGTNTGLNGPIGVAIAPLPQSSYHPLTPARITDTRTGSGFPNAGRTLSPGATLNVQVTDVGGVPGTGASAAALNVTATNPTKQSFLTVWPTGASRPTASNLNFRPGQTVPNLAELGLGTNGQVSVFNPAGSVDVVVDVEGYVGPSVGGSGLYDPLTPARITDTRASSGEPNTGKTLGAGATLNVHVTGAGGVPASGVGTAALNVTATGPTGASFLTVWPAGKTRPTASNLNFGPGQTVPNRVIVPVGTGGQVSIFNAAGSVDVVVDVGGYFTDSSDTAAIGAQFEPITPTRITDTRPSSGFPNSGKTLGPGGILDVQVTPVSVTAAVVNVTVTNTTGSSFLTVWPTQASRPTASDLNWVAGQTVPNLVVATLGIGGDMQVFNASGSVDVVVDLTGLYP